MTWAVYCNDHTRRITIHSSEACPGLGVAQPHQAGHPVGYRKFETSEDAAAFAETSRQIYGVRKAYHCKRC